MKKHSLVTMIVFTTLVGCQAQTEQVHHSLTQPIIADTAHSARTSLDWNGIYKGLVPCNDCAGTNLLLELKTDGRYSMGRSYIDKISAAVMEEGQITWNKAGNTIKVGEYRFFVAENKLILVDQEGNYLTDEEGHPYSLSKDVRK